MKPRKFILGALVVSMGFLTSAPASAIVISSFGPFGEAGSSLGRTLSIGDGGEVFELDSFLSFGGPGFRLSTDPLPAGLDFVFGYGLSDSDTDLTLSYTFTNNTGGVLDDVRFISYLDAEIDELQNTFFNEYGEVAGTPGADPGDADPDSWEIDEPGFLFGDIYENAFAGTLDLTNSIPIDSTDDVAMALGFFLGPLNPGGSMGIRVLLSEDMRRLGSLALVHKDFDSTGTVITMSGRVVPVTNVPEPGMLLLLGVGLAAALLVAGRKRPGLD